MGTDIHGVFQKRTPEGWQDVPSQFECNRHYFLFSVLADVRNGYGFAGVPTYSPVKPVAAPRGLPADFKMVDDSHPVTSLEMLGHMAEYHRPEEPLEIWMGDHSHSWLTTDEILEYVRRRSEETMQKRGILDIAVYHAWDKVSEPEAWCGGVGGPGILVSLPSEITPATTHVECKWVVTAMDQISYFTKEVQRLKDEHGEVRFVFGFDS